MVLQLSGCSAKRTPLSSSPEGKVFRFFFLFVLVPTLVLSRLASVSRLRRLHGGSSLIDPLNLLLVRAVNTLRPHALITSKRCSASTSDRERHQASPRLLIDCWLLPLPFKTPVLVLLLNGGEGGLGRRRSKELEE